MSQGGDTADMMVKEGIEITEAAVKLAAMGMKNLAALLLALAKDEHKVAGLTNINRMLKDGSKLKVFELNSTDMTQFAQAAKDYGILFTAIADPGTGLADVVVREGDIQRVSRIFERMGYAVPVKEEPDAKNANPRARPERKSNEHGNGSKASVPPETTIDEAPATAPARRAKAARDSEPAAAAPKKIVIRDDVQPRTSVVSRIEAIKRAQAALKQETAPSKAVQRPAAEKVR